MLCACHRNIDQTSFFVEIFLLMLAFDEFIQCVVRLFVAAGFVSRVR